MDCRLRSALGKLRLAGIAGRVGVGKEKQSWRQVQSKQEYADVLPSHSALHVSQLYRLLPPAVPGTVKDPRASHGEGERRACMLVYDRMIERSIRLGDGDGACSYLLSDHYCSSLTVHTRCPRALGSSCT